MNPRILMGLTSAFGVAGLLMILGGYLNPFTLRSNKKRSYDTEGDINRTEEEDWPLFARVMKSILVVFQKVKPTESNDDLQLRLQKAGFPFYSPAHYYSRQFANTFLFGGFGLLLGVGYSLTGGELNPLVIFALSIGTAIYGSTRPASEVKAEMEKRNHDLVLDMAASMSSLIVQIKAKNAPLQAIMALVDKKRVERNLELTHQLARKIEDEANRNAYLLGLTLEGFGGNLFADMLNRLAIGLSENKKIGEAIQEVRNYYPYSLELDQFLEIFGGGIRGELPMVERLLEFSKQLKISRSQRRKEQGAKAQMVVSVANVFLLIPTVVLFIAPLLSQIGSFFGK